MLFKLSIKNIKKSIKDYSIYFFTLVFAVALFYAFNSIDAQASMMTLSESKYQLVKVLMYVLNYVSIFVSIVLGFLIVYSNNFLIKRRKKEIGLYFTLGMSKRKVSIILVVETLVIGIISLAIGLLFGVALSQLFSIFTAKLFEVNMSSLKFIFSSSAFFKTILYFGIIFVLLMVFSVISLNKYKLIDLLNASKINEKVKQRNKYVTIISFILCVISLGIAYYMLFDNVLVMMDYKTGIMIGFGALGTLLLFYSLSGFLLKMIERIKKVYYKNLNIFLLRQFNNRINSTVISTTVISLMLLLTVGILSCSISVARMFNNDINSNNRTDYSIAVYENLSTVEENGVVVETINSLDGIDDFVKEEGFLKHSKDFALVHTYTFDSVRMDTLMDEETLNNILKQYGDALDPTYPVMVVPYSEYVRLMEVQGSEYTKINNDEYLLLSNLELLVNSYKNKYENGGTININNSVLKPGSDKIIEVPFLNAASNSNDGMIVVSDELIEGKNRDNIYIIGNFVNNSDEEKADAEFYQYVTKNIHSGYEYRTKASITSSSIGTKALMIFIGLYLGITFAITSATILAIGQLSESSDNKDRYKVLSQLGCDNKMINKALFTQILLIFAFPLVVALVHAYFGLREINSLIYVLGKIDIFSNVLLVSGFMILVYGGYFLITYICSKNIIKN